MNEKLICDILNMKNKKEKETKSENGIDHKFINIYDHCQITYYST